MNSMVVQEAAAALTAGGSFQSLSCAWVAGEPQQQHGHRVAAHGENCRRKAANPAKEIQPFSIWLNVAKSWISQGKRHLFLSNSVLRFPNLRQQAEQALCTHKCTSPGNSTFSPFGLQFLRQLCVTEVHVPRAEPSLLLRLLRTTKPQHGSSHSLAAAICHPQLPAQPTPPSSVKVASAS